MLNKKRVTKEKTNLEFLITTFIISLLTIMGVFMSHYNSDKFKGRIRVVDTVVLTTEPADKIIAEVSTKIRTITFSENTDYATTPLILNLQHKH